MVSHSPRWIILVAVAVLRSLPQAVGRQDRGHVIAKLRDVLEPPGNRTRTLGSTTEASDILESLMIPTDSFPTHLGWPFQEIIKTGQVRSKL